MFCNLEIEYPPSTRQALFNNWLVNLEGRPGHFLELDLMQEHFNHWLEDLAQYKGKEFDDKFYREVLSMHVHHFIHLVQKLEGNVGLAARRKMHSEPHVDNELREVIRICREHDLHHHHIGRDLGFKSSDYFADGVARLSTAGKLDEWIVKTMEEWENLYVQADMPEGSADAAMYLHEPIIYEDGYIHIN
jgi:hypothetical protein